MEESDKTLKKSHRAIDLYSGVGGWSFGLRLAGIDVVASYEIWGPANETNFKNNAHQAQTVDIRRLSLDDLPSDIDIVVGSPPCTQFSYSNRGGSGDVADGLEDIKKFLTIVDHLKPTHWAMENVPRVAKIIEAELESGGELHRFRHLGCETHIVDMAAFGLPQRRKRCIAGNFSFERLNSFKKRMTAKTLGDVLQALGTDPVVDPLYGVELPRDELTEHHKEDVLSDEEARINRANKTTHHIYNSMPFPDPLDRSVRTITATCTRVSRESVVVRSGDEGDQFRRLTLRERASLQGFPITFQFYGTSYGQKLRMIGNAVPPAFTYLMGKVLVGTGAEEPVDLCKAAVGVSQPGPKPPATPPDKVGSQYPEGRTFRFAIPSLRLKSGVRFEFRNQKQQDLTKWQIQFYFGTSKEILDLQLNDDLKKLLLAGMSNTLGEVVKETISEIERYTKTVDFRNMQSVWSHRGPAGTRPFTYLDMLDEEGKALVARVEPHIDEATDLVNLALEDSYGASFLQLPGIKKLQRNAPLILSGLLIGASLNPIIDRRTSQQLGESPLSSRVS
ncbi:DNA cytosine methyltransferase [Ruegeria sp.]|uniref:DNA cytosine methyltransferase n=1 Tax=Ruegeria sp. TaxID=1879320 RepID=UPI003C7BD3D6